MANTAVASVRKWLESVELELSEISETSTMRVGNHMTKFKDSIKYLGVVIDSRLSFKEHLKYSS